MGKAVYIGVNGVSKKAKKIYIGVDGVAKKVKKVYIGVNGVAKLCYSSDLEALYTGDYTDDIVTMGDGKLYRLLTFTSSGTLTLSDETVGDLWLCDGGQNGGNGYAGKYHQAGSGGCGGYKKEIRGITIPKTSTVVIGAGGGGATKFNSIISDTSIRPPQGGTGASIESYSTSASNGSVGRGADETFIPFNGDSYFTQKPCAGGGGGSCWNTDYFVGGGGGASDTLNGYGTEGTGGQTGGGQGQYTDSTTLHGYSATYYGSGGGGGATWSSITSKDGAGGAGYQGICYLRIPI